MSDVNAGSDRDQASAHETEMAEFRTAMKVGRTIAGWSQQELGERISKSKQWVSYVESGRHIPNLIDALSISAQLQPYYGKSLMEVFGNV